MRSIVWLDTVPNQNSAVAEIIPRLQKDFDNIIFNPSFSKLSFEDFFTLLNRSVLSAEKDQVSLVAYSWGAYLALTYLSLNPDHVESLFLINPLLYDQEPQLKVIRYLQSLNYLGKAFLYPFTNSKASTYLKKIFSPQSVPFNVERLLKSRLQSTTLWQEEVVFRNMVEEFPLSEDLKSVPQPIHAMFGNEDAMCSFRSQTSYFKNYVNFSSTVVEQAGHALPWTHTDLVADEIRHFFKSGSNKSFSKN